MLMHFESMCSTLLVNQHLDNNCCIIQALNIPVGRLTFFTPYFARRQFFVGLTFLLPLQK
jgi:hypothetical protein